MTEKLTFIQISDTHIDARCEMRKGVRPASILSKAVEDINEAFPHAAFVVHTGDVASEATRENYELYQSLIRNLQIPLYHVRGNHDSDAGLFRDMLSEDKDAPLHWNFKSMDWHFIGVDCGSKNMTSPQFMRAEELQWVDQLLSENAPHPTFLFLHSHFHPVKSAFFDGSTMGNSAPFIDLISTHECVQCVAIGHLHHPTLYISTYVALSCPSLYWQFLPNSQSEALDDIPPGYRVFEIDGEGSVFTYIRRLSAVPKSEHTIQLETGR